MRLWTVHPRYLDPQGLVALWREALLAQAVLAGRTRGYTRHPQLQRFAQHAQPFVAIGAYLQAVYNEAHARGYRFDASKIMHIQNAHPVAPIEATLGQLDYEWQHLGRKLAVRNPSWYAGWLAEPQPQPHPLFVLISGPVQDWERV